MDWFDRTFYNRGHNHICFLKYMILFPLLQGFFTYLLLKIVFIFHGQKFKHTFLLIDPNISSGKLGYQEKQIESKQF